MTDLPRSTRGYPPIWSAQPWPAPRWPGWCSAAVPLRLLAGTRGARARPPLRTGGRAQGPVTGGPSGHRRALLARDGHRRPHIGAAALFRRPGRRQPFRSQLRRGLPGQGRDPPAHPGQGLFERLGLQDGPLVLWPRLAPPAVLGHGGAGGPAVLADVLVPGTPDPGFQLDGRVLIKRGELGPPRLGDQQSLGVVEHGQQGRIHRFLDSTRPGSVTSSCYATDPSSRLGRPGALAVGQPYRVGWSAGRRPTRAGRAVATGTGWPRNTAARRR